MLRNCANFLLPVGVGAMDGCEKALSSLNIAINVPNHFDLLLAHLAAAHVVRRGGLHGVDLRWALHWRGNVPQAPPADTLRALLAPRRFTSMR